MIPNENSLSFLFYFFILLLLLPLHPTLFLFFSSPKFFLKKNCFLPRSRSYTISLKRPWLNRLSVKKEVCSYLSKDKKRAHTHTHTRTHIIGKTTKPLKKNNNLAKIIFCLLTCKSSRVCDGGALIIIIFFFFLFVVFVVLRKEVGDNAVHSVANCDGFTI